MTKQDFYTILGVQKGASDKEIKNKYYLLAKEFHPDKNQEDEAEEKFKEIKKAYEAIKDVDSRREYDLQRRAEEMEEKASHYAANCAAERFGFNSGRTTFSGSFAFNADDLQDVFSRAFKGRNKENAGPKKDLPTGMKLSCNYCSAKFHPAQLTIHEKECRDAYYGKSTSNASDSSNEEAFSETYTPRSEDFTTNEAYIPKAEAAASSTYPSGGESPSSSTYIPKTENFTSRAATDRKPAGSSLKNDLLREAYLGAINETLHKHKVEKPIPEEPKQQASVSCEHCGGSFSETVAKYHIPFCARKHGVKDSNNNASSASSSTSASKSSQSREFTSESSRPKYKATARPSPSTTRSAYDRVTSPSFTNLGSTRPRATASSSDYMDEPYTPSYTPRVQTNTYLGRPSSSSTRIRYIPASTRSSRLGPHVGI